MTSVKPRNCPRPFEKRREEPILIVRSIRARGGIWMKIDELAKAAGVSASAYTAAMLEDALDRIEQEKRGGG